MAVAVQIEFTGATLDQYDESIKRMGFRPGGPAEPGLLFHWVTGTPGGLRATDVWESREAFNRFAEEKLVPMTREVGIPAPPAIQFYDVHNHLIAGLPVRRDRRDGEPSRIAASEILRIGIRSLPPQRRFAG